jgi:hypothetical protein
LVDERLSAAQSALGAAPGLTEVACRAHALAADELGPGAGWQGYSLRARGNQNIEIAASNQ